MIRIFFHCLLPLPPFFCLSLLSLLLLSLSTFSPLALSVYFLSFCYLCLLLSSCSLCLLSLLLLSLSTFSPLALSVYFLSSLLSLSTFSQGLLFVVCVCVCMCLQACICIDLSLCQCAVACSSIAHNHRDARACIQATCVALYWQITGLAH